MKLAKMIETRLEERAQQHRDLVGRWMPYISVVESYLKEKEGKKLSEWDRSNIAQCLENALLDGAMRGRSKVFETSFQDNISFLGIQLPVIAALLPSLVLNEISIVQALDRRQGSVFYLDIKTGQKKGEVASGSTLIGSKTGHASGDGSRKYSMDEVVNENLGALGSATYTVTLDYKPVIPSTVNITTAWSIAGVDVITDNGLGVLTGTAGSTGTINYATGAVFIDGPGAETTTTAPLADYRFNYEKATALPGVAEVDVNLTNETLTARDFTLRSNYTLGSAIDLEKAHGLILEDEVVKYLGGEIKFEIDNQSRKLLNSVEVCLN